MLIIISIINAIVIKSIPINQLVVSGCNFLSQRRRKMFRKRMYFLVILALIFAISQPVLAAGKPPVAPVIGTESETAIAGRYIVVFNPGAETM
jgi:hypothetical protein